MIVNAYGKGGGSYLEPGDHLVHIFEVKDNERTDKPAVDITYKNDQGQTIKDTFWVTDKALFRIANLAIACGYAGDAKDEKLKKLNTTALCGREVMIRVAKETSQKDGKEYSVVKSFWKPNGAAPKAAAVRDPGRDDEGFEAYDRQKQEDPF